MTEGRRPPEQASLEADFESQEEPSGIDAIQLFQESSEFPEQRELSEAGVPSEAAATVPGDQEAATPAEVPLAQEGELRSDSDISVAGPAPDVDADAASEASDVGGAETLGRFPLQWVLAGVADLAVHLAVVVVGVAAAVGLGLPLAWSQWPGYLVFALSFSFLYTSLPLAFWGQTPGMAVSGLRAADGARQLSFGQTCLRWGAAVLTVACLGLPLLLARSGRPLADRMSRSETLVWHELED